MIMFSYPHFVDNFLRVSECLFSERGFMRPVRRKGVSKHRSARQFKRNIRRTKAPNMRLTVMRGGIRL